MHQNAFSSFRTARRTLLAERRCKALLLQCLPTFSRERVVSRSVAQLAAAPLLAEKREDDRAWMLERRRVPPPALVITTYDEPSQVVASSATSHPLHAHHIINATQTHEPSPTISLSPVSLSDRQKEFYLFLQDQTKGLDASNRPSVRDLRAYHNMQPALRTTQSYNMLINYAISSENYANARWLFNEMLEAECVPNTYTWRLRIKLYLAQGCPWDAYACAVQGISSGRLSSPSHTGAVPFEVWAQLLRSPRPSWTRQPSANAMGSAASASRTPSNAEPESAHLIPQQLPLELLLDPSFLPSRDSFSALDYRSAADIVSLLSSHSNHYALARSLCVSWVRSLPAVLTTDQSCQAFHIINRTLRYPDDGAYTSLKPPEAILRAVRDHVSFIVELRSPHAGLRPDAKTLRLLLRLVGSLRNPAREVGALVKKFDTIHHSSSSVAGSNTWMDFSTRTMALNAILKDDQWSYRYKGLVKRLLLEQEAELARGLAQDQNERGSDGERVRGQQVAKYFAVRKKAQRLGNPSRRFWEDMELERSRLVQASADSDGDEDIDVMKQ